MSVISPSTPTTEPGAPRPKEPRLTSLDACRGAIMLFMASAGFGIPQVAEQFPDSRWWGFFSFHTSHAPWVGGGAWDMIQPAFMFMVGVAMPYSYARRIADGQSFSRLLGHALWRSFVLVALAVFLASKSAKTTTFIFTNVLGQIGLGYTFLFLLLGRGWKVQVGALAAIAIGTWAMFVAYPAAPPDFDFAKVGVKAHEMKDVVLPGFFAHWSKNANAAASFDRWFLNLFPHDREFVFNAGGYTTLNFLPSLITMILGLMTGEMLRRDGTHRQRLLWMLRTGAVCLLLGLTAGLAICPIVKRIWTPSWALFSGGIVVWLLAAFYWAVEVCGFWRLVFPLVVVGMNSIAIYLMDQLLPGWIVGTLRTHLGQTIFDGPYGIVWQRVSVLALLWLTCWWMYRRKIFRADLIRFCPTKVSPCSEASVQNLQLVCSLRGTPCIRLQDTWAASWESAVCQMTFDSCLRPFATGAGLIWQIHLANEKPRRSEDESQNRNRSHHGSRRIPESG